MELRELLAKLNDQEYEIDRLIVSNPALVVSDFESFYLTNPRHYYHEVFLFLKEFDKQDDLDFFVEKIRLAKEYFDNNASEMLILQVNKLYDHIKLEVERNRVLEDLKMKITQSIKNDIDAHKSELTQIRKDIEHEQNQVASIGNKLKEAKRNEEVASNMVDELKKKVNDVYMQFVTILGIFTAIVFSMFGGITAINSTISVMANNQIGFEKALAIVCVFVAIMVNLLYLFVFLIGKMINRTVGYNCKNTDNCYTSGCANLKKDLWCRLRHRHSLIFWSNIVLVSLCMMLVLFHFRENVISATLSFVAGRK